MRAVLLRSLAVIAGGGLVLIGVLYVASTVDVRPPTVLEIRLTAPAPDDERRAQITSSLEVVFSEAVVTDSAEQAVLLEPSVPGSVSWSGATMTMTPRDPLRLETAYRLVVTEGVRDPAGNEMTELPPAFEFRTLGRPTLLESTPADGDDVAALDAPIRLVFSTLMDTTSVESVLEVRPAFDHELRWRQETLEIVPAAPLEPGTEYEVVIGGDAADPTGVTIGEAVSVAFRTLSPGLAVETLVPADGVDGVSPASPIAVFFDRPIDPETVADALTVTPAVAGTLDVVALPPDALDEGGAGSVLRFVPSGPLAPNTTFEVVLAAGPASLDGGTLTAPMTWSFTTGAPGASISNGIAFLSDRAGVTNVWVMNRDGTGQRQVSAELLPVVDYAVAPDGSSLVVSDGRDLVYQRADGGDRRVLTADGLIEFDPAYAPDGRRVAFARADAASGEGLGIWEWPVGGGDPVPVELPQDGTAPQPPGAALRTPRYSPEGDAIAFVDLAGSVGILELETDALTSVPFDAAAPPTWTADGRGILVAGREPPGAGGQSPTVVGPVAPLEPGPDDAVHRLARAGTSVTELQFGLGSAMLALGPDGSVAFSDAEGWLRVAERATATTVGPALVREPVAGAAFALGEPVLVVALASEEGVGSLELIDLPTGERTPLVPDGTSPRWLP